MKYRMFVDFNATQVDDQGELIPIGVEGSRQFERYPFTSELKPGMKIFLTDGELEVEVTLEFNQENRWWDGRPDWETRLDMASRADGLQELKDAPASIRLAILKYETETLVDVIDGGAQSLEREAKTELEDVPLPFLHSIKQLARQARDLNDFYDLLVKS